TAGTAARAGNAPFTRALDARLAAVSLRFRLGRGRFEDHRRAVIHAAFRGPLVRAPGTARVRRKVHVPRAAARGRHGLTRLARGAAARRDRTARTERGHLELALVIPASGEREPRAQHAPDHP